MAILAKPVRRAPKPRRRIERRARMPRSRKRPAFFRGTQVAELDRVADRLFSRLVKAAADGKCQRCGRDGTDTAHVFSRDYRRTRWSLGNAFWLCRKCHDLLGSARLGKPSRMEDFYVRKVGPILFSGLKDEVRKPKEPPNLVDCLDRNAHLMQLVEVVNA